MADVFTSRIFEREVVSYYWIYICITYLYFCLPYECNFHNNSVEYTENNIKIINIKVSISPLSFMNYFQCVQIEQRMSYFQWDDFNATKKLQIHPFAGIIVLIFNGWTGHWESTGFVHSAVLHYSFFSSNVSLQTFPASFLRPVPRQAISVYQYKVANVVEIAKLILCHYSASFFPVTPWAK